MKTKLLPHIVPVCKICLLAFFLLPTKLFAQPILDFYGQLSLPHAEFGNIDYNKGLGAGFSVMSNTLINRNNDAGLQLRAGANFAYSGFGSKKFELELAEPVGAMADVRVQNSMLSIGPVMRASFSNKTIQPYIEAFAGWNIFYVNQNIKPINRPKNAEYEESTDSEIGKSSAWYYGAGIGNLIKFSDVVYGNIGIFYSRGVAANVLPLNNVYKEGNELRFNFIKTPSTDMVLIKFGLSFKLFPSDNEYINKDYYDNENRGNTNHKPRYSKPNEIKKNVPNPVKH